MSHSKAEALMGVSIRESGAAGRPQVRLTAGFSALVAGAVAMGLSPILVRLADVGPFSSAFFRVALALPALHAWMRIEEARQAPVASRAAADRRQAGLIVLVTGLSFAADLFFWHLAILKTTVANATFFATTAPVWVLIFGWALFGRRPGLPAVAGLGLCLAGGGALVAQSFAVAPGRLTGDGLAEVTAVFFGAYFLAVERARGLMGPARLTFQMSVVAAVLLGLVAVAAALAGERLLPAHPQGWAVLAALALISHAGGQGLLSVALGILPAMFSSLVIFLEAVAAGAFGWMVLGEAVTPLQGLGGLVILAGIFVARPRPAPTS